MKLKLTHDFDVDEETFWTKIFLDLDFNRTMYLQGLGFPEWNVLEEKDTGTSVVRRVRVVPKQDAPAAVRKVVGDAVAYTEEGTFDKATRRYRFRAIPSTLADKFVSHGEMWSESTGPKTMRRTVEMTIEVKIFAVGGVVESFVGNSTRESYERSAEFTRRWIREKGL